MTKRIIFKPSTFPKISKKRKYIAFVIGICFALSFYILLYLIREYSILLTVKDNYDVLFLSKNETYFYNFISAFISFIFGQSIVLLFFYERPKAFFSKQFIRRRSSVLVNQKVLFWVALFALGKIVFSYYINLGSHAVNYFYITDLFSYLLLIFALLCIALFAQSWNQIRLNIKNSGKWMRLSFLIITTVSILLSFVPLYNFSNIKNIIHKKNIHLNYNYKLPQSGSFMEVSNNYKMYIYLVEENKKCFVFVDNKKYNLVDFDTMINDFFTKNSYVEPERLSVILDIAPNIKMKYVESLKRKLKNNPKLTPFYVINFAVTPKNAKFNAEFYRYKVLQLFIEDEINISEIKELVLEISQKDNGDVYFNTKKVEDIKKEINTILLQENNRIVFHYKINTNITYSQYISTYIAINECITKLQDIESQKIFKVNYNQLNDIDNKLIVLRKIPFYYFE